MTPIEAVLRKLRRHDLDYSDQTAAADTIEAALRAALPALREVEPVARWRETGEEDPADGQEALAAIRPYSNPDNAWLIVHAVYRDGEWFCPAEQTRLHPAGYWMPAPSLPGAEPQPSSWAGDPSVQDYASTVAAPPAPAQPAPELDVRRILLDIVPGDGNGEEVYAKSVADVERKLYSMGERIEELESKAAQPAQGGGVVAGQWEGAEEWMPLAWALCADEHGEEACTELIWEGGAVPEPWGDRWLKYEGEAKRLIALVREHVPTPAPAAPDEPGAFDAWLEANRKRMHQAHYSDEDCMRAAWSAALAAQTDGRTE